MPENVIKKNRILTKPDKEEKVEYKKFNNKELFGK